MRGLLLGGLTLLLTVGTSLGGSPASAITFDITYDQRERPYWDPTGALLVDMTNHAAAIWSRLIPTDDVFSFDLSWEDLDGDLLGIQENYPLASNIIIDTRDAAGVPRSYFFDPTPRANEEFSMGQTLVRDLDPVTVDHAYDGRPPALLEAAYHGPALYSQSDSGTRYDLLSVILHEMGHLLGFNFNPGESNYDMNPSTLGGLDLALNEAEGMHSGLPGSLMGSGLAVGERRLPSATDVLALWDESDFSYFDLERVDYLGLQSNLWSAGSNWIGGEVPYYSTHVFIRHGGVVRQLLTDASAQSLRVDENSGLQAEGTLLRVYEMTRVGSGLGQGEIHIGNPWGSRAELETDHLFLGAGLVNLLNPAAVLDVNRNLDIASGGALMGAGVVEVGGRLTNNGEINGGTFQVLGFGGQLTLRTTGAGKLDLDGSFLELGVISATSGNLRVEAPLADAFTGQAFVGATRTMTMTHAWTMDGALWMQGGAQPAQAATLAGGAATIKGLLSVVGKAVITAPVVLDSSGSLSLSLPTDTLTLANTASLQGGVFSGLGTLVFRGNAFIAVPSPDLAGEAPANPLSLAARYAATVTQAPVTDIHGPTNPANAWTTLTIGLPVEVAAGGVVTASTSGLRLGRRTTMSGGRITGTNKVTQVGDLVVTQTSTIDPGRFVWGAGDSNHRTTIAQSRRLNLTPGALSHGTASGYAGRAALAPAAVLNVDVGSATSWTLAGSLELGARSVVRGDDLVNNGVITGVGSLAMSRLVNNGTVAPGLSLGQMLFPGGTYEQSPTGTLAIDMGGMSQGVTYDVLRVGAAQLSGKLAVMLVNGFVPALGASFDILTAATSITGTFGQVQVWSGGAPIAGQVQYFSNRVAFVVTKGGAAGAASGIRMATAAVPEPSSWVLAAMGALALRARRSRLQ